MVIRPANGTHAKLCGHGPRAEVAAARRLPRRFCVYTAAVCSRRDAAMLVFGRGASAPDRKPGRTSFSVKLGAASRTDLGVDVVKNSASSVDHQDRFGMSQQCGIRMRNACSVPERIC